MVYKTFIRVDKKNTFKIYVLFNDIFFIPSKTIHFKIACVTLKI